MRLSAKSIARSSINRATICSVAGAFAEFDGDVHFLAAAIDGDGDAVAGAFVVEGEIDVELGGDFLVVDGGDDVATDGDFSHAGFRDAIAAMNAGGSGG